MTLIKKGHEEFVKKIGHAERILDIVKLRELLTSPRRFRKNFPILQELGLQEIRAIPQVRSWVDQTIVIALPLLLVYSVSCLEFLLSTSYQKKPSLSKMISENDHKADKRLTQKIHEIRIKRNIIIHSYEQKIDEKALKDLKDHQIMEYELDQTLELTPENVKADLNSLREFSEKIAFYDMHACMH